jgi:hypothetical protein
MPAGFLRSWKHASFNKIKPTRSVKSRYRKRKVGKAIKQYNVPKNKQTHYHVRRITASGAPIGSSSETDFSMDLNNADSAIYRGLQFTLGDLENYTELTQLYDQYMITKVVMEFLWTITGSDAGVVGPNPSMSPYVNCIRDYDDSITPTSDVFRESGRVKRLRLTANKRHIITLTPAVLGMRYKSATSTAYGPQWKQRIDMADPTTPHFGLKLQLIKCPLRLGYVQVTAKYYVSCYQTR